MKAALLALLMLAGCANGIEMSLEQAETCKQEGCATHTERDLQIWSQKIFREGFKAGRRYEKGST